MNLTTRYGVTTFAPPSWPVSGNPTPTPGTPAVISNATGGDYNSFPSLVVINTNTLALSYRKGGDHNSSTDGALVFQTKPFGGAWSALETVVAADAHGAGVIVSDPNIHALPDGRILMVYGTVTTPGGVRIPRLKVRSAGGTWGSSSVLTTDFPSGQVTPGGFSATFDSTVLHPMYARTAASGLRGIYLYQAATSDLTAWTQRCNIVVDGARNLDWEEPCLFKRSDGLAICLIRDDVSKLKYLSWSPDLTRWSYPLAIFAGYGKPNAGINPDDDMLCISRHSSDARAIYSFSGDSGRTWTAAAYIDDNTGSMQYGSVVWLPGTGWVGVYGVAGDTGSPEEYVGPSVLYEIAFT